MQGALHDHDILEARVDGLAHDDAAAKVRPYAGIFNEEVLNGGAVCLGKKARVALGVQNVVVVVKTLYGVVLAIEHAGKRMLFVAKRQVLDGARDNGFHVIAVKFDVIIEINMPAGRIAFTR